MPRGEKKLTYIVGVLSPVKLGERVLIRYGKGFVWTTPVVSILAVTADYVKFETQNSIYAVTPQTVGTVSQPLVQLQCA